MKCENCGEECWRDSADVGVGVIYGPWGCSCGWSESEEYNQLTGPKKTEAGGVTDQYGIVTPVGGDQTFFEGFERIVIDSMADASELISGLITSGKEFRVDGNNGQSFGRVHRRQFVEGAVPVQSIVDIKVLTDGIEVPSGPTLILPLSKCKDGGEHGPWVDNYTYCIACGYYDKSRTLEDNESLCHDGKQAYPGCTCNGCSAWRKSSANYRVLDVTHNVEDRSVSFKVELNPVTRPTQTAPVGNQVNEDLKAAYAMGFRAAREIDPDDFEETQDYVDQRRSDLKELVSYDRSLA